MRITIAKNPIKVGDQPCNKRFFEIRVGNTWRTVATLKRNPFDFIDGAPQFYLYFREYGSEHLEDFCGESTRALYGEFLMSIYDAIEWATPIVQKKLYKIADGIMSNLRLESEDKE